MLYPALYRAPGTVDAAARYAPIAVFIHAPGKRLFDGENEHPVNDVIVQGRAVNVALLGAGGNDDLLLRGRVLPPVLQSGDQALGVLVNLVGAQAASHVRQIGVIAQLSPDGVV